MAKSPRSRRKTVRPPAVGGRTKPGSDELAELQRRLAAAGAPPDMLDVLNGDGELSDLLREMIQAGMPSPEDSLAAILDGWRPTLEPGADQLRAELSGAEFLGMLRAGARDEADVPAMLADLIKQAESTGRPEAPAMLRVLAVIGPPDIRGSAADAADRLVAAGLTDPPWVSGLGAPRPGPSFGYIDLFGFQEAIVLTFSYAAKKHAFCVLIDHGLGGGVKDCWISDRVDIIRTKYRQSAGSQGVELHNYEPAQARAILEQALGKPPCPVEPDQVEDTGAYLDLLRQRVALLTGGTSSVRPGGGKRLKPVTALPTVYQVKVTLRGSKPPIWRRLRVPSGISLAKLHEAIQAAFGWAGYHLWVFETPLGEYGLTDPELGHRAAASKRLSDVVAVVGDRIRYTYDFGDDWDHDVRVEDVIAAEPGVIYPRCVAGRRACPPEDCGGIWGYDELLEILADPAHPEHEDRLEWLSLDSPDEFDPAKFDLDGVNRALSGMAKVLRKR